MYLFGGVKGGKRRGERKNKEEKKNCTQSNNLLVLVTRECKKKR